MRTLAQGAHRGVEDAVVSPPGDGDAVPPRPARHDGAVLEEVLLALFEHDAVAVRRVERLHQDGIQEGEAHPPGPEPHRDVGEPQVLDSQAVARPVVDADAPPADEGVVAASTTGRATA